MRIALVLLLACSTHHPGRVILPDAAVAPDALACRIAPSEPCNPSAQTGCDSNSRCTWFYETGQAGHNACALDGLVDLGGACAINRTCAEFSLDDCKRGLLCHAGACRTICDLQGVVPCPASLQCVTIPDVFEYGGFPAFAGVCMP